MGQLETSVRSLAALYLAGSLTAEDFAEKLPDGWDLDESGDDAGSDLTLRVMGYLSEYENGDRTESELQQAIEPLALWRIQKSFGVSVSERVGFAKFTTAVSLGAGTEPQGAHA